MRICPKCGRKYNYIERRLVGRRIYVYAVHYLGATKKRCLIEKRLSPEVIEAELRMILREAKEDRETLLRIIRVIIEFLSSIT